MRNVLLSVIVPTYNMELYLSRCLQSLLLEDVKDYVEIIVINDGSRDCSSQIAHQFQEKYGCDFLVIIDKENAGYGSVINRGIQVANGKYIKICDSDDWFEANGFISFVQQLKNIDADLVYNKYSKEYVQYRKSVVMASPMLDDVEMGKVYDIECVKLERLLCLPEITYKAEILRRTNLILLEKTLYTDLQYVTFPIGMVESIAFTDVLLYRYFIGRSDQSISQQSKEKNIGHLEMVIETLVGFYKNTELSLYKQNLVKKLIAEGYTTILCTYLLGFYNNRKYALLKLEKVRNHIYNNDPDIYHLLITGKYLPNRLVRLYTKYPWLEFLLVYIYHANIKIRSAFYKYIK